MEEVLDWLAYVKARCPECGRRVEVSQLSLQDAMPYCFIFRQSVTVLIFKAPAAFLRLRRISLLQRPQERRLHRRSNLANLI